MKHEDWCEADIGHEHDCTTATELAALRAFAGAIAEELSCTAEGRPEAEEPGHVDDCWPCAARAALEKPGPGREG